MALIRLYGRVFKLMGLIKRLIFGFIVVLTMTGCTWPVCPPECEEADLRQADLRRQDDYAGANMARADLTEADLVGADLTGANLQEARLVDADLILATLREVNLQGADLRADAEGADFTDANLAGANLNWAILKNATLIRSNLSRAFLENADLTGANLTNADLTGAFLEGTDLSQANLTGTTLEGITSDERTKWPTGFEPTAQTMDGLSGQLFFIGRSPEGGGRLYRLTPDASSAIEIPTGAFSGEPPAVAPDGTRIAYVTTCQGEAVMLAKAEPLSSQWQDTVTFVSVKPK